MEENRRKQEHLKSKLKFLKNVVDNVEQVWYYIQADCGGDTSRTKLYFIYGGIQLCQHLWQSLLTFSANGI